MWRDAAPVLGRKARGTLGATRPGPEVEGRGARFELAQLVDRLGPFGGDSEVADRLGRLVVAEASQHQGTLTHELPGHEPPGDVKTVWLEGRERLGAAKPRIVGESRRRSELHRAVVRKHDDPDPESGAPVQGIDRDRARRTHDHDAT